MMKEIRENPKPTTINSYLSLLERGNTRKTKDRILAETG